jgi:hypothetical protein
MGSSQKSSDNWLRAERAISRYKEKPKVSEKKVVPENFQELKSQRYRSGDCLRCEEKGHYIAKCLNKKKKADEKDVKKELKKLQLNSTTKETSDGRDNEISNKFDSE